MESMYDQALANMEDTLHFMTASVPRPKKKPYKDGFVFRYEEQTIHQAIVLKLARIVSGLHAARLLMEHGFVQEQGALQRIQDELDEDVQFLSVGAIQGKTPLHDNFLKNFWEEEFDAETALESTQKRSPIPRQKIRAYLAQALSLGTDMDPSRGVELHRTISKSYSGYVHAAAPHIMDMYGGNPPRFHVRGLLESPLHADHREDFWNYFYRAILAFGIAAAAFGDADKRNSIVQFADAFGKKAGHSYFPE